jgi:hypothetical protein
VAETSRATVTVRRAKAAMAATLVSKQQARESERGIGGEEEAVRVGEEGDLLFG